MEITNVKDKYVLQVGYEFEVETNITSLIKHAIPVTNCNFNGVSQYHNGTNDTAEGLWRLEHDASLRNGAEFISPPIPMEDSFSMMKEFFQSIKAANGLTTERCGCHTNICLMYNGRILKMNENALICNINWQLLYALWPGRLKKRNSFCESINNILDQSRYIPQLNKKKEFANRILNYTHGFIVRKQSLLNKKGIYYELRFPGGEDYHLHPEKIEDTVRHFNEVLYKSRLSVCRTQNVDHNKKIVSYINRKAKHNKNFPHFNGTVKTDLANILNLKSIKHFNTSGDKQFIYNSLIGMLIDIIYIKKTIHKNSKYGESRKDFLISLIKTINKENVIYYIYKFAFVYGNATNLPYDNLLSNVNSLLKTGDFKFTIPKKERDLNKLWLLPLLPLLPDQTKDILIKSITSNRIKILADKLIQNRRCLEPKFFKFINNISTRYLDDIPRNRTRL